MVQLLLGPPHGLLGHTWEVRGEEKSQKRRKITRKQKKETCLSPVGKVLSSFSLLLLQLKLLMTREASVGQPFSPGADNSRPGRWEES